MATTVPKRDGQTSRRAVLAGVAAVGAGIIGLSSCKRTSRGEPKFGLFRSTDRGASWTCVGYGLPDARINALGATANVTIAGTDRGIFTSYDAGESWRPARNVESRILCIVAHHDRVFVGTQRDGVLVSEDGALTFQHRNVGLTDVYVRSLLSLGPNVYAGTDDHGVFVSDGSAWTSQRDGLPDGAQVFDLAAIGETIFAGLYSRGLYRWIAVRKAWTKAGEVVPLELATIGETLIVGHNPGGVFVSKDLGLTWHDANRGLPPSAPTWTLAADDESVFLGTSGKVGADARGVGLLVSSDRCQSWSRSDVGLPASSAPVSLLVGRGFVLVGMSS